MFSTFKQKLLLGIYIFIILSIPIGAYLVSQQQTIKSSASEPKTAKTATSSGQPSVKIITKSPTQELLDNTKSNSASSASPSPDSSSPTIAKSFGPTLAFKIALSGRPTNNQTTKLFVGIIEGDLTSNPKFILNFSVDVPSSGEYSNLSLAGLTVGNKYTALLKGSSTIATSSAFTMLPNVTSLNNSQSINLTQGDLNEDNVINTADYSIVQKALGSSAKSSNWNENADLNKDGTVNTFDLALLSANMGIIGASGAWTSPIPKIASPSAQLIPGNSAPVGGPGGESGYWIWIPK